MFVTASKLYDYFQCPHRVWRDVYGPMEEKIKEPNAFIEMLWEKGVLHEDKVIASFGKLLDLSSKNRDSQFQKTIQAMKDKIPLIYHGYIRWDNLAGEPDLLRLNNDGSYVPEDIKSGRGVEGASDDDENPGKPKKHYAVQLALYAEILINLGFAKDKVGIIYDIDGKEVSYDLNQPQGLKIKSTWWECYQEAKNEVTYLITDKQQDAPAYSSICKLCPWYNSCKKWLEVKQDPTLIFYLGRAFRKTLQEDLDIQNIMDVTKINISSELEKRNKDKTYLKDIAEKRLKTFTRRAQILLDKKPIINPIVFPKVKHELFFDIEDDPTQGFVYLHGVYERINGVEEPFHKFVAKDLTDESERQAWLEFWQFIRSLPENDFCLYYYSIHEPSIYKRMQSKYPDVVSLADIDWLFNQTRSFDLYFKAIFSDTDWPLYSYSLKDIAHYLNFNWRDKNPSGAMSIQWFNEYLEDKDPAKLQRIIDYNEDDCKATMVIKDFLT